MRIPALLVAAAFGRVRLFQPGARSEPGACRHRVSGRRACGAASRPQVPARTRRRCRRRAALRGRLLSRCRCKEKTLVWHLYQAALAGRDIFIDQKHRSALEMRGVLEQIVAHPHGRRRGDAGRGPALHQALLAQQRPLQQPHRAQVRADVHAAGVRRGGEGVGVRRARPSRPGPASRSTQMLARLQPMFFDPAVDPIVTNKNPGAGQGHPAGERQQPLRRRRRWRT